MSTLRHVTNTMRYEKSAGWQLFRFSLSPTCAMCHKSSCNQRNETEVISRNIRNSCNSHDMMECTLIARRWSHGRAEVAEDDDC